MYSKEGLRTLKGVAADATIFTAAASGTACTFPFASCRQRKVAVRAALHAGGRSVVHLTSHDPPLEAELGKCPSHHGMWSPQR